MQINRIQATPQKTQAQPNFKHHFFIWGPKRIITEELGKTFQALEDDVLKYGDKVITTSHSTPEKILLGYHIPDRDPFASSLIQEFYYKARELWGKNSAIDMSDQRNSTEKKYIKALLTKISEMADKNNRTYSDTYIG